MKKILIIALGIILLATSFFSGCIEESIGEGTLQLQITDKPGDLDIIYANVTISMIQVHKSEAGNDDDDDDDEIIDDDDDLVGLIVNADGPYKGETGELIVFNGTATGGEEPYNWSWDFGDGNSSYDKDPTYSYDSEGTYDVNLTVTDNNSIVVLDTTVAMIGEDDDESTAGWYTIVNESQTFDLIALQNVTDILGTKNLTEGKYTQIRLTVEKAVITINNSSGGIEVHDLKISSNKVKLIKSFWIFENETTVLTLDFNVYESVHKTGSDKYIMKPTIKVIQG